MKQNKNKNIKVTARILKSLMKINIYGKLGKQYKQNQSHQ